MNLNHALRHAMGIAFLAAACWSTSVSADDTSTSTSSSTSTYGTGYVSMMAGLSLPAKDIGTTGRGATASGIFGHEFSKHVLAELNIQTSTFETGVNGGTDFYQNGATLDLVLQLRDRRQGLFTPFLLVGVGAVYDDFYPNNRDGISPVAEAGVGLVSAPLSNGIRFRVDARYMRDTHRISDASDKKGFAVPRLIVGVDVPLGRVEHRIDVLAGRTEVREIVREVPAPQPLPQPQPQRDTDGDGVDDNHDRCPDTPRGMQVDAQGCALADQTFTLAGVNFNFNEARLTAGAESVLDRVSLAFIGQPSLRAEIAGHTDSVGSEEANRALSQARSESVRSYLLSRGVRADQLVARGYGKSQLLIPQERTEADGERNRRVELRVLTR